MHDQTSTEKVAALTVLRSGHWFRGLSDDLLRRIAQLSVTRVYARGEIIFHRDDPGDYLYGIIAGSVRIFTQSSDGQELALNTHPAGDIGGEIAALDGGVRTASARALDDTTLFMVHRDALRALMLDEPQIALHLIDMLCERVRWTSHQVESAAFLSLAERLADQLQVMVEAGGGQLPTTLRISQSELASFLNVSRQAVNGCLQDWQRAGCVQLGRGSIEVLDLAGLRARAVKPAN